MEDFNLKALREKLGLTQSEMAASLEISQETVSRLEKNPQNMSVEIFMKLCQLANMLPNDLLSSFKLAKPKVLNVPDVYAGTILKKRKIQYYVEPKLRSFSKDREFDSAISRTQELMKLINTYGSKPLVALLGPSDAGKSTLINSLTGIEALLSQWTPTTAATVYLKHIDDKPFWLEEGSNVCIFKAESKDTGWNFRNVYDEDYCNTYKIVSGDYDVLETYCNRNASEVYKNVDSAVVFLDSPILKACDIVDLPGFGTEELNDTIQSQRAREQADIILFLCQSNSFFNKMSDIVFLKDVIRTFAATNNPDLPLLSNLFVIASQAHIVEDSNVKNGIEKILNRGKEVISQQISEEIIEKFYNTSKVEFLEALSKRFFTYSIERPHLRRSFEEDFTNLLTVDLPPIKYKLLNLEIDKFKQSIEEFYTIQIKQYQGILHNREQAQKEYEDKMATKSFAVNDIHLKKNELIKQIRALQDSNLKELSDWEPTVLNTDKLKSIINEKGYDKKKAQEFLSSNLSDLYYAKLQEILLSSNQQIQESLTEFFQDVEGISNSIAKINVKGADIPFDFKGAFSGGIAGASVLGALGFWASTVGNLGGYILVAKGVSLLSALGISVGGTAAAASFVSLIGGPITIGIGIALGTFFIIKTVFGSSWKDRIAEQVVKLFKNEKVLDGYKNAITKYWDDTVTGIEYIVQNIIEKIDEQLQKLKEIIDTTDQTVIESSIDKLRMMEQYFQNVPWDDDKED